MGPLLGSSTISPSNISSTQLQPGQFFRSRVFFPVKVVFGHAKLDVAEASTRDALYIKAVLASEREEAKAILTLVLKKQGLSSSAAARTIRKSDTFIDHLVSRLHSAHRTRYLVGRELTTLEIRDALIPYLENMLQEHENSLDDVVESFPDIPLKGKVIEEVSPNAGSDSKMLPDLGSDSEMLPDLGSDSKMLPDMPNESWKLKATDRVSGSVPLEKLPEQIVYLMEFGMGLEEVQKITKKFPAFAYYNLERKVKPLVEFLLDLGVSKLDIPIILAKRPQLCGVSLSENIIPTMKLLEGFGVDKEKWASVITRFPPLLTYSRQKLISTVEFLYEMGLTEEDVGKVLSRWPAITAYSIEEKLRPTAEYFKEIGVNVSLLLPRSPMTFGLSIEQNLKPVTEFFLLYGYTLADVSTMVQRYGSLYTFSLKDNMIPKWEYFLTLGYPRSELVKFPQYFGYSLEERIKPRIAIVQEKGVKLLLSQVLSLSSKDFDKALERKLRKKNGSVQKSL